jgi:4-hydroxy-tetrahydrodipicolinate synthase
MRCEKMAGRRVGWKGVFVPIVTPFTQDHEFDEDACRKLIEEMINEGVHGIILAGSTGEWFTLTNTERTRLFEVASDQAKRRVTLLGGTSAIATRDVLSLTKAAKDIGMDGALILPPPYILPNTKEIIAFYERISSIGLPIMVYNNPARTQVNINAELAEKLASFETVVAFKDSAKDIYQMSETIRAIGDRVAMFCGLEPYAIPLIQRGAVGIVAMSPNIIGRKAVAFYLHAAAGEWSEAVKIENIIDHLYSYFYSAGYCAYVVIKEAMKILGRPGGWPRPPLLPMDEVDRNELMALLERLGLV